LASFSLALLFVGVILRLLYIRRISLATRRLNAQFDERLAERTRISQDLHDTLLQGFLGVTMRLQAISNLLPAKSEKAKENLDEVLNQIDIVLEEGRRAIWDIHSSTVAENDLMQAFTLVGEDLNKTYPANFSLTVEGENRLLHPLVRDGVYRIGREALTNAFRHSKATKIDFGIKYAPKSLRIFIRDDGCGISPDFLESGREGHLGLRGMRDFAEKIGAELKIWSRAESGTEVELVVPHQIAFVKKSSGGLLNRLSRLYGRKATTCGQKDQ
jgi:signal transduction histidine kinase